MYKFFFKRAFDFSFAFIALAVFASVLVIIALLLALQNNGNPFFLQVRPGKDEKPFKIIKFKTMTDDKDVNGDLLPDNQRITALGRFVRKTSLDELPQLINVLKGDMSLVGPRPLLFKYIPLYTQDQKRRHEVRPGITGWAQVNGRNSISWNKKFSYDIEYVNNISFKFDFQILWLTFQKVIKREGVNQSAERPMQPFNGKN
jgi:undecaprenyl phosphate N,N'-diacetylbacillosamine 1-phosphate transferase